MQVCPECGEEFRRLAKHMNARHGAPPVSRDPSYVADKKRAYYEANKAEIADKKRAYYEANKAEIADKKRAYREANKAEIADKQRAYYEANKAEIADKQRAYYEAFAKDLPELTTDARRECDEVAVELAADQVLAGEKVDGLHPADRTAAAIEVMRRGGSASSLRRLGFNTALISAFRDWWKAQEVPRARVG
jgi:hypothetical protein